jgi:hypothetical protein
MSDDPTKFRFKDCFTAAHIQIHPWYAFCVGLALGLAAPVPIAHSVGLSLMAMIIAIFVGEYLFVVGEAISRERKRVRSARS